MSEEIVKLTNNQREALLKKYFPKFELSGCLKWGVYKIPPGSPSLQMAELVCKADSKSEAEEEIRWRLEYLSTKNKDLILKHDKRFQTFEDDSETGKTLKDYTGITFDEYEGEYFIMETYSV